MNKYFLFLFLGLFSLNSYAQITFEQGYFIDNNDKKIDCLIKNQDWQNNPVEFEYRLSTNDERKIINIESVKEFGISGISKYIREKVQIDRSSEKVKELSTVQEPVFKEEQLFLKVLLEGEASLFQYVDQSLKRYFYRVENRPIEQLIYKSFKDKKDRIFQNKQFKQQLSLHLKCASIKKGRIENLTYAKSKLMKLFIDYNQCKESKLTNYVDLSKRDAFNLTIRPGINSSSLNIWNISFDTRDTDFGTKINFRLGLEAEFIMSFNKSKWSIIAEPTYQYFKSKTTLPESTDVMFNPELDVMVNYQSLELPIGVRHYFFLNKKSKVFLNAGFIFDISGNSIIDFDSDSAEDLEINSNINFYLGAGFKFLDRFSAEARYLTNRDIFNYTLWSNDYKTLSLIFGYTLF